MTQLVPNRFLFDFELPIKYVEGQPKMTGKLRTWTDEYALPSLSEIDGRRDFAQVWAGWNESGLYFACKVTGKSSKLVCDPARFWTGDNVRLCTDMRDTRSIKRATKTCQQFYLLPTGGGVKKNEPVAGSHKIKRAKDDAPSLQSGAIPVGSKVLKTGYSLEAHIPATALSGFDPREHPRIGFFYIVEDSDLGQQYLTVGDDLQWHIDPSTWATAVLT